MATTLSRMMKKAAASSSVIVPLANRTTRTYISAILTTPLKTSTTRKVFQRTSIPTHRHFSALAVEKSDNTDDSLLSVTESEIDSFEEKLRKFPFKIKLHEYSKDKLILTREYLGDEINVEVDEPKYYDHSERKWVKMEPPYLRLNVSVTKKSGQILELCVKSDADIITIEKLELKQSKYSHDYLGEPGYSELVKKLQKDFCTYLEVRGIEPSINKILYEYMDKKMQKK